MSVGDRCTDTVLAFPDESLVSAGRFFRKNDRRWDLLLENGAHVGYYGGMTSHRRKSPSDTEDFVDDAAAPAPLEAGINGGGVFVYWEVNADGEGRCYTLINDERVDRTVLRLLLDETGPPSFVRKSWLFKFIEDDRLIVDLDARPSQPDFEKLHDRCIGALQIMREPTKEQAMALMAHKERAVRNYALAQMQRWSETWSGNEPKRVRRPTRVYHQR